MSKKSTGKPGIFTRRATVRPTNRYFTGLSSVSLIRPAQISSVEAVEAPPQKGTASRWHAPDLPQSILRPGLRFAQNLLLQLPTGFGRKLSMSLAVASVGFAAPVGAQTNEGAPLSGVELTAPVGEELQRVGVGLEQALGAVQLDPQTLRDGASSAVISVRLDEPLAIGPMQLEAGTQVRLQMSDYEARVSLSPGAKLQIGWLEPSTVSSFRLDFQTARVELRVDGFSSSDPFVGVLNVAATDLFKPYLPEAMRTEGYVPSKDADLQSNVQLLIDRVLGRSSAPTGAPEEFLATSELELDSSFTIRENTRIPIADNDRSIWIKAGTRVSLSVDTQGPVNDPQLEQLQVRFSQPVGVSSESDAVFDRMDLNSLTIRPGGQIYLNYKLGPEQVIDDTRTLLALLVLLAEPSAADRISIAPSRMDGLREDVQGIVDQELEPMLNALIAKLEPEVPALSLHRFFAIEEAQQRPD